MKKMTDSFFGMHMHNAIKGSTPWPENIPFKVWRLWDLGICWPEIEPKKRKFNFSNIDKAIELAEKHNVELILNLGMSPKWAAKNPKKTGPYGNKNITKSPPKDIEDWKEYVQVLADRYNGRIKYWEIWNEPDFLTFYCGKISKLVELTKEARKILKKTDKNNMILSPSITGFPLFVNWLDYYLFGAKKYIDIIGFHFYPWFTNKPESIKCLLKRLNNIRRRHGIEKKPLWNTESGYFNRKNLSKENRIGYIARSVIIQWWYNIEKNIFYALDNKHLVNMIGADKKTVGDAYRILQKWLVGATLKKVKRKFRKIWVADIKLANGNKGIIVWHSKICKPITKLEFRIPWEDYKLRTLDGISISVVNDSNAKIKITSVPILIEKLKGAK